VWHSHLLFHEVLERETGMERQKKDKENSQKDATFFFLLLVLLSMPELSLISASSLKRTAHKTKTTPAEGFQNKSG